MDSNQEAMTNNDDPLVEVCRDDTTNSNAIAPPLCESLSSDTCQSRPYLPQCPYKAVTYDVLKANPHQFLYDPNPPLGMQDQVSIIHYQDEQCRDSAGFGSYSKVP